MFVISDWQHSMNWMCVYIFHTIWKPAHVPKFDTLDFKCNRSTIQRFLRGATREYLSPAAGEAAPSRAGPVTLSLAVNTGSTLGGQTAFWLYSSLRKGAWSSQWVSPGLAAHKSNNEKQTHSAQPENRNKTESAACGKNPPAWDQLSYITRGETGRKMKRETFPLAPLLTPSQRNALIKQPCWLSCNSASILQHQVRWSG